MQDRVQSSSNDTEAQDLKAVNLKGEVKLAQSGLRLFFLATPGAMIRLFCVHPGKRFSTFPISRLT